MIADPDLLDGLDAYAAAVRPLEDLSPSAWSEKYRDVKGGPFPGPWLNENAPYLVGWMDAVAECLRRGLRGVCGMKSAQGAGSEALGVNALAWLLTYFPGPYLYLTAIDRTAEELSRDRWSHVLDTCEPLAEKHLGGKSGGERILVKRFTDAKLVLSGSQSPNNYISNPFRGFVLDEYSATSDQLTDGSDPLLMLLQRLAAWAEAGSTIGIVLGHPSDPDRGEGRLYYEESDQRRGHVVCPHCDQWIAPDWVKHVRAVARAGQSSAQAERDPSCYVFVCPGTAERACGVVWSEADRLKALRVVEQRSTLSPEVLAALKPKWIGVHFWRFFLRSGGSVEVLAAEYIAALGDPAKLRVFFNKVLGDVYEEKEQDLSAEVWDELALEEGRPHAFRMGTVPSWVQWLTAGQDSRLDELHWVVCGWGWVRSAEGAVFLCGALVDAGVLDGPRRIDPRRQSLDGSDLAVFDQVLYLRMWERSGGGPALPVWAAFHDSGWQPTAVYEYTRSKKGRGFPSKGGSDDDRSKAPACRWSDPPTWLVGTERVSDPELRRADLNVYRLKTDLVGDLEKRFRDEKGLARVRLALPHDAASVHDRQGYSLVDHFTSERCVKEKGRRRWARRGGTPNHWWDCLVMARAAALNVAEAIQVDAVTHGRGVLTRDEELLVAQASIIGARAAASAEASPPSAREQARRAAQGGGDSYGVNTEY